MGGLAGFKRTNIRKLEFSHQTKEQIQLLKEIQIHFKQTNIGHLESSHQGGGLNLTYQSANFSLKDYILILK